MTRLIDFLWAQNVRDRIVADCEQLIESHVASRGGLKGIGLRTSFAMIKSLRPDAVPRALRILMPQFAEALEPLHQEWRSRAGRNYDGNFERYLVDSSERATEALLKVADERAESGSNKPLKAIYGRLRGSADAEIHTLMPRLAKLIGGYVS